MIDAVAVILSFAAGALVTAVIMSAVEDKIEHKSKERLDKYV